MKADDFFTQAPMICLKVGDINTHLYVDFVSFIDTVISPAVISILVVLIDLFNAKSQLTHCTHNGCNTHCSSSTCP